MPLRLLACLLVVLLTKESAFARAEAAPASVSLPAVHGLIDSYDVPGSRKALAALSRLPLSPADALGLEAARGRFALLTYDLPRAKTILTAVVRNADAAGARVPAAWARVWLAQTLGAFAEVAPAQALTREAYDVLVSVHDQRGEFSALQLQTSFSHVNQRALMERQLQIAQDLHDAVLEARVRNHWAAALLVAGRSGLALAEAEHAERLARSRPREGGWLISHALALRAWGLRAHGDNAGALALNREGIRSALAHGDLESAAWNWVGAGDSLDSLFRPAEMAAAMRSGLAVARRTGMPSLIHSLTASVARSEFEVAHWAAAARLYEAALAQPMGDSPVYPTVRLAECRRHLGQFDAALHLADRALATARDRDEPDGETQALVLRAEVLQALGREEEARRSIAECLERLEALRRNLAQSDVLKRGFADVHDDYAIAVNILEQQGRAAEALAVAEQARARALADLLLSRRAATDSSQDAADAERQDGDWRLGGPPAAAPLPPSQPEPSVDPTLRSMALAPALDASALAGLARQLETTILIYWVHDEGSYAWVVSADGSVHGARLALARPTIDRLVADATTAWPAITVRGAIRSPAAPRTAAPDARAALERLYRGLVSPVERWMPAGAGSRLTIIPHGSLFQLSFAALIDRQGRYLIERYAMSYAQGGAALADALTERPDRRGAGGALLVADPFRPASTGGTTLPQLAGARAEVRLVSRTLTGPRETDTTLVGESATEEAVRAAAPRATLIHIAAHAFVADGAGHDPYIALAAPRTAHAPGNADGHLTATEIYALSLSADLVVLSACRSARGRISSDGIADLTRAFIAAGAPSVIASLWDAADEPTAILMREFYRGYAAGAPKDVALRSAQLHLLRQLRAGQISVTTGGVRANLPENPMFWAGFVLAGTR